MGILYIFLLLLIKITTTVVGCLVVICVGWMSLSDAVLLELALVGVVVWWAVCGSS